VASQDRKEQFELACMFSDMNDQRRYQIEEFVTWRNLQALRAAAANGAKTSRSKVAASRKKISSTAKRKTAATRAGSNRGTAGVRKKAARAAKSTAGSRSSTAPATGKTARKTISRRSLH
jgi:hypothetical protein